MDISLTLQDPHYFSNENERNDYQNKLKVYVMKYPLSSLCFMNEISIEKETFVDVFEDILFINHIRKTWDNNLTQLLWEYIENYEFSFEGCTECCSLTLSKVFSPCNCLFTNGFFKELKPEINNELYIVDLKINHEKIEYIEGTPFPDVLYEIQIGLSCNMANVCSITSEGDIRLGQFLIGCMRRISLLETVRCIIDKVNHEISFVLFNPQCVKTIPIPEIDLKLIVSIWYSSPSFTIEII